MTELSFLLDLLMNHKLQKETRELIRARIIQVEANLDCRQNMHPKAPDNPRHPLLPGTQAASTLAAMARHQGMPIPPPTIEKPSPVESPVEQIAQTPETAAALASRNQAIAESIAGKIDKVSGRPRKW